MKEVIKKVHQSKSTYFHRNIEDYFLFCQMLKEIAKTELTPAQTPIFLCIGTDRITGDCLGPLVGHKLKKLYPDCNNIYGTLENPVHAKNIDSFLNHIYSQHSEPFFIAIDASLGLNRHIGCITLSKGSLFPGEGVKKSLPSVGDIAITGIVNSCNGNAGLLLQNTRLHLVNELSEFIYMGIANGFSSHLTS